MDAKLLQRDAALLLLIDAEGRCLLQHRSETAPTYPGYWGFFGGGVENGETPAVAVQREAFEELRYVVTTTEPVLTIEYTDQITGRFGRKFYFSETCSDKGKLELHEGQGMGWFTLAAVGALKIRGSNLSVIEKILALRHNQ